MVRKNKPNTTKNKILAAAHIIFTTKGMTGARMQDIANEAKINKAMLHYYFKDKNKLFETVFMEEAQKFFPKIKMILQADIPLFEKIEKFVNEYIDEMLLNPYLPWFVINEINRDAKQFISKFWNNNTAPNPLNFLNQIEKEIKKGTIKRISPLHFFLNLLSVTIFPIIAKPLLITNFNLDELQFRQMMEQRRKEIPKFIIDSIKK